MLHTGEKCHVQRQSSFWQKYLLQKHLKQSWYFMLFWPSSILAKSLFIHVYYTQWWCIQLCLQKHLSPWITKISWTLWYPCHFVKLRYHCKRWSVWVLFYKLFDLRDAIVQIAYIDNRIPQSTFYSAIVVGSLRIARTSLLYKNFHEKVLQLLNRMATQGAQSLRCREVWTSYFKLDKIYKTHCQQPCFSVIYIFEAWHFSKIGVFFEAWHFVSRFPFFFTHDIVSVFPFFDTWKIFCGFFFSLTHDPLSAVCCPIYVCNIHLKRCEMFVVFIIFYS